MKTVRVNYDYYNPRTDHTYGSSLGPSIQAIMACDVGKPDDAYEHFIRAVRADLRDVRGNAGDGIHAASAGGTWQAVVFGFGGLARDTGWLDNTAAFAQTLETIIVQVFPSRQTAGSGFKSINGYAYHHNIRQ